MSSRFVLREGIAMAQGLKPRIYNMDDGTSKLVAERVILESGILLFRAKARINLKHVRHD